MAIKIYKSGLTIDDVSYGGLHVELNPFIEMHYNRVSVNTKCYTLEDVSTYGLVGTWIDTLDASGNDVSTWVPPAQEIIPQSWERFNPVKIDFELEASTNLEQWSHEKVKQELVSKRTIPYEYMKYEADVYELDPSSGEPVLDPCTNQPIILHAKDELIKKANGTYQFYTRIEDEFCQPEDVSIHI
jgi:hypothetical protein